MQFIKTLSVKDPIRNANENAGIDFYIPDNTPEFRELLKAKNPNLKFIEAPISEDSLYLTALGLNKISYMEVITNKIYIAPHQDIIIPSGIKSKFAKNLALIANNKSGIATKKKLIFGASVIDSSYQGLWHFHMINWSDEYQEIECGQKIIQFIPHIISTEELEICNCSEEEFFTEKTSRGEGWAGSTGI